ncbi:MULTISPECIES: helix-turn-helix transcriptional regulator [Shewanella]|uniref:helix-turn-helix transcriptional regulator n=1 Tax=Shewanella TaxID=22 RepID=UPI001C65496B|nr:MULTISPECIES: AlpA family transcriptional regulator [Shewanella]MCL1040781.1 AlpA family transcriptional regulator [Shewanella marisflavi]QYJ88839.1 AlpA family transcriptional regulator [Shewanella halotolerans]
MKVLRLRDVIQLTGLARSTIYDYIAKKQFPKPIDLGERAVGWLEHEIQDWIQQRIEKRDA